MSTDCDYLLDLLDTVVPQSRFIYSSKLTINN